MVKAAGDNCDLHVNSKIISLDVNVPSDDGNDMITAIKEDGTTITAKNAVLACGPWTNEVLGMANLPKLKLDIWMVQWAHYEVDVDVGASIPQAFYFKKESGIDGGLYYVFPASATECLKAENGKTYVKVGVDFPTNQALDNMKDFNYQGSDDVMKLMVSL
jgi:sarcosine oxidase